MMRVKFRLVALEAQDGTGRSLALDAIHGTDPWADNPRPAIHVFNGECLADKGLSCRQEATQLDGFVFTMMTVQIFGLKGSQATRAAERFFKERQVPIQLVDLKQKAMSPGEIRRFVERFGLRSLLDVEGKAYVDAGMKYMKVTDQELLERIERDPKLLRLPLVRAANRLSVGPDEDAWREMVASSAK